MPTKPLATAEVRSWQWRFPTWAAGTQLLKPLPLPSRVCTSSSHSQKLKKGLELKVDTTILDMGLLPILVKHLLQDSFLFLFFALLIFILFEKSRERDLPLIGLLPTCLQKSWLGQDKARCSALHPGLSCEWQEYNCLIHHLLPARAHINRMLDWK